MVINLSENPQNIFLNLFFENGQEVTILVWTKVTWGPKYPLFTVTFIP